MELLWLAASIPAVLALVLLVLALRAFSSRRAGGGLVRLLSALLFFMVAMVFALVAVGMNGYRTFIAERTAAQVEIEREGPQTFRAHFTFPDGSENEYRILGDELYVDARILKWHPRVNLLGLETGYQLDRVAGRYRSVDNEQTSPRTVYSLSDTSGPVDLFALARRYPFLAGLVDAEYGSASFLEVRDGATYQVRVSNTGLLIRELPGPLSD